MRSTSTSATRVGGEQTVDLLVRAVLEQFPDLDREQLQVAIERGFARAASASLNTEGHRIIDLQLARVEATEEAAERAAILRELATSLEGDRGDAERAFAVRLAAFGESPSTADLAPLLRLARVTERERELPLDAMAGVVAVGDDDAAPQLVALGDAWQRLGRAYAAADCYERAVALAPSHANAHAALEVFYRSTAEWPTLVELLSRRALHAERAECAALYREIAAIYERELADEVGALDAYREADRLAPDQPEVLAGIARLASQLGDPDGEALAAYDRLARVTAAPRDRAAVLARAAAVAKLSDWDRAGALYDAALAADPDLAIAIEGLAELHRDRGSLDLAGALLVRAAARPALAAHRSRYLAEAADFAVATGDFDRGKALYREAWALDATNHKAGVALVELHVDAGSLVELVPVLDELCRDTEEPQRLHGYLVQRGRVALEMGDADTARAVLARAVAIDPADRESALALAGLLHDAQDWPGTLALAERLLDDEDRLPAGAALELHFQAARSALALGELDRATRHLDITLALAPDHRGALMMRRELATTDPAAHAAAELALTASAPASEQGVRYAALGDRYLALGDRATALEMFREALVRRPTDKMVLTKSLTLVSEAGDWSYSLDLVHRLVDTERDARVRARYRTLGGRIARDELRDPERAARELTAALEDDPTRFDTADELEALLSAGAAADREALVGFYYRRLDDVRQDEGRGGERLRLWDHLAEECLALGRHDDAIAALEVGLSLVTAASGPSGIRDARRKRLAGLYAAAGPAHVDAAIAAHQDVLRADHRRASSYAALRTLYARRGDADRADALTEAIAVLRTIAPATAARATGASPTAGAARTTGVTPTLGTAGAAETYFDELFAAAPDASDDRDAPRPPARAAVRALGAEDWAAIARVDVDLHVAAVLSLVAPAFAIDRARVRPPAALPAREHELPALVARVLARVVGVVGSARPPTFVDRDQAVTCKVVMRAGSGALVPALVFGGAAAQASEHELAFRIARALADLRTDRIARLLCPRPGELAQVLELVLGDPVATRAGTTPAARWLATALHPVELEQAVAIGARLAERGDQPLRAALDWLAATERAADRVGLVIAGDLGACATSLGADPTSADRALDLVWASVTDDLLTVRTRTAGR